MDSDVHLPRPPEYEAEQTGTPQSDAVQWLEGTHTAERVVRIQRNPDPSGGPNTLDERASGMTTGLGQYDLRIFSDLVS